MYAIFLPDSAGLTAYKHAFPEFGVIIIYLCKKVKFFAFFVRYVNYSADYVNRFKFNPRKTAGDPSGTPAVSYRFNNASAAKISSSAAAFRLLRDSRNTVSPTAVMTTMVPTLYTGYTTTAGTVRSAPIINREEK